MDSSDSLYVNSGIYYPIDNWWTGSGNAIVPFVQDQYSPYPCNDCLTGGGGGGGEQGAAEMIALNNNPTNSQDEAVMKWDNEKKLFEKLLVDSALIDSSIILENFMDTTQFNNKGLFGELSNDYKSISEERIAGANTSIIDDMIADATNRNNLIIPNGDHELSQKQMNEIFQNTILNGLWNFSPAQKEDIMEIAYSCPFFYGPSVYEARALATFIDGDLYFDDNEICNQSSSRKKNSAINSIEITATIFPNPASNKVNLTLSNFETDDSKFVIVNVLGEVEFSYSIFNNNINEFNVSILPNGVYACYIVNNKFNKMLGKLTIMH